MERTLPSAKSANSPRDRANLLRAVSERGLVGLANDTKWDEFVDAMRSRTGWRPSYRCKCVDGPPSEWDTEWYYHLPFPLVSVEWLDVAHLQEVREHRLPPRVSVIDHSEWIASLLQKIGLDYRQGATIIRIFGYYPRNLELFDA